MRRDPGPPRGVIETARSPFRHVRVGPGPELAAHLRHFWIVEWDLEAPHVQANLPHPSAHIVIEPGGASLYGVPRGRFVRELSGRDAAFGIALRPGVLPCFTGAPAWRSTGSIAPLASLWPDAHAFERAVLDASSDEERVAIAERFLLARLPPLDPDATLAAGIVETVERERGLLRVEQLAARTGLEVRSLQRLFRQQVGVTPKWVLQRYRIHEALARIAAGEAVDFARLAADLGYADQAHFANRFKAFVGCTPSAYVRARASE